MWSRSWARTQHLPPATRLPWPRQRSCQMSDRGIGANDQVQDFHDRGGVHEGSRSLVQVAIQINHGEQLGHARKLVDAVRFLQAEQLFTANKAGD